MWPGSASALVVPTTEAEIAEVLQSSAAVLPIGAQSSLTGGATPRGDVVLSTARLNRIISIGSNRARVEAGVTLADLDAALARAGAVLSAGADLHGRLRGRHRRDQRRRRRDVQVRHHTRLGRGPHGRPADR